MRRLLLVISLFSISHFGFSQKEEDTALYADILLPELIVFDDKDEFKWMYAKAKYYVAKMYPYALLVKDLNAQFESDLAKITSKKEKKRYIKNAKQSLELEFDAIVRDMSHNEGRFLCKLIHRETKKTTYEIIQEYNGDFSAITWQTISRVGGANLKYKYDTKTKEDYVTELVLREVREGKIQLAKIEAQTDIGKLLLTKRELKTKKKELKKKG
ncbi:MAG: DUF4294 domain-containing protein [Bacteroidia bacterium]